MSDIKMMPCIVCSSKHRDLMGYDFHKVSCSNQYCLLFNVAQDKNAWNCNYTESPLNKQNTQLKADKAELVEIIESFERAESLWLPKCVDNEHISEAEALHELRSRYLRLLGAIK